MKRRLPPGARPKAHPLTAKLLARVSELLEAGLTPRSEVRLLLKLKDYLSRRLAR